MKTKLFTDSEMETMGETALVQTMEAESMGVEELHDFLRPFNEDEQKEVEEEFLFKSKELNTLKRQLDEVSSPLKEAIKPVAKETARLIDSIQKGGVIVSEKVYLYPDYESSLMGLYDSRGVMVATRSMTRSEKQLHINSGIRRAVNE